MKDILLAGVLSVAVISSATAAVSTAQLTDVEGPVLVDSGKGFVPISARTDVSVGSRILVSKGGKAVLAYADGCNLKLVANSVTTVVSKDGCRLQEQLAGQAIGDKKFENGKWFVAVAAVGVVGGITWAIIDGTNDESEGAVGSPISR